jgi:toxin YoeB
VKLLWQEDAWADYLWWQTQDKKYLKRINTLINAVLREPLTGVGKPEQLRGELAGFWSRRIDEEHRLVYRVTSDHIEIAAVRYHYTR